MVSAILSRKFVVKPSESNAQQELPLTILTSQVIDLATDHANLLGIGFIVLSPLNAGWVLSRLTVQMERWPKTGDEYTLSTWVESWNSHFSERCFSITDSQEKILGFVRTVWVVIDLSNHKSLGTSCLSLSPEMISDVKCPVQRMPKLRKFDPDKVTEYRFKYCDLDFYRHVNTVRYISIILNQLSLDDYDNHILSRFDIAFNHEAKYGELATLGIKTEEAEILSLESENIKVEKHSFEMSVGDTSIIGASLYLARK